MITNFWDVPGFWQMAGAMILFAAAASIAIAYGPGPAEEPEPGPTITTQDLDTIRAWGLTLAEWNVITEDGKRFYRDHITKAPHFAEILR